MDSWVLSSFEVLQRKCLWTFMYKSLYEQMHLYLLGKYLLKTIKMVFQNNWIIHVPTISVYESYSCFTSLPTIVLWALFWDIFIGVQWYLIEGNGNPLQYSCLENSTDGGAWWAAIHGVSKNRTQLSDFTHWWHPMVVLIFISLSTKSFECVYILFTEGLFTFLAYLKK